jgi:predicted PurR-regulated permease PerM
MKPPPALPYYVLPYYAKASLVLIGTVALLVLLYLGEDVIVPLIYSTVLAIVLSPVVDFLVNRKMNRVLAISVTLITATSVSIVILSLLSAQMMQLAESLPNLVQNFHLLLEKTVNWASGFLNISTERINHWLAVKNAEVLRQLSNGIGQTIVGTGSILIMLVLIPVYIFMILLYQHFLLEFLHRLFATDKHRDLNQVLSITKKIVRSYLSGLMLEALIVAILNSVCLLALGIEYAILIGVIGALLNIIPYIGGIIAVMLPMLIALATTSPVYVILVLAGYSVIQFVDNNFIIPRIVASKVKINGLISIIVVLMGGMLWGLSGMFLAIPLTAIIKVIFDHVEGMKAWGYLLGNSGISNLKSQG